MEVVMNDDKFCFAILCLCFLSMSNVLKIIHYINIFTKCNKYIAKLVELHL